MKEFINFDSSKISWFHCGGKIAVYCVVETINELVELLKKYPHYKNKILPIGAGSNILIGDEGFNGLAVKLAGDFNKMEIKNKDNNQAYLVAGSGVFDKQVAVFALKNNLISCEFLDTIPGTIGGAVKMNAGCFDSEIKNILVATKIFVDGKIIELQNKDLNLSYRHSELPENAIVLEATFLLQKGTEGEINKSAKLIEENRQKRKENQITGSTCGSTFANPVDKNGMKLSAWKLLDEAGMRGYSIGGAKFSEKHCNFLINTGTATTKDIEDLISLAKQKVKEKFEIDLHEEVKIIHDI